MASRGQAPGSESQSPQPGSLGDLLEEDLEEEAGPSRWVMGSQGLVEQGRKGHPDREEGMGPR